MKLYFGLISLFFVSLFDINIAYAINLLNIHHKNNNFLSHKLFIAESKIGVVDFRNILKQSSTMKKLGKEFLKFEKKLNDTIEEKEIILRNKEKQLSAEKDKLSKQQYNEKRNKLKKEITNLQKFAFNEKKELSLSFQLIQKKLRDILASVIKNISEDKNIDLVVLKENVFLINNFNLDLTNEALKKFDDKTSNLKIQLVRNGRKKIE